jgi:8-oxo-dGTP pyrophosphatase MutT (NUDIX family)
MKQGFDLRPFPNVGNSPFYKEYSVAAMLPTGLGSHEGWGTKLAETPIETVIKRGNEKIDKAKGQPLKGDDATTRDVIRRQMHDVSEVNCLMEAEIMAYGQRKILNKTFFYDKDKIPNCVVSVQGYPGYKFRGKSEMIVFRGKEIFCEERRDICKFPGGGWDPNEKSDMAAVREVQEESLMNVKNVHYAGTYINIPNKMPSWVSENVPKEFQWNGYYVDVYVGDYDSPYEGKVDEHDKDEIAKNGKFVTPNSIWKKLNAVQKQAILQNMDAETLGELEESYMENKTMEGTLFAEYVKNRAKLPDDVFGVPELRKYPMPDKKHVISAIKLFNHVDAKHEKELARNIKKKADEFGLTDFSFVGKGNRFSKYLPQTMLNVKESIVMDTLDSFFFTERK